MTTKERILTIRLGEKMVQQSTTISDKDKQTNKKGRRALLSALMVTLTLSMTVGATNTGASVMVYNMGKVERVEDGYTQVITMDGEDAHYGWELGQFSLEGFTQKTEDSQGNVVFLKTTGDQIQLNFTLNQDINQLNGDEKLRIVADEQGVATSLQMEATDFGRGIMSIQRVDYQNQSDEPVLYVDYLSGVTLGANTQVLLLEEGDYTVSLYYKVGNYGLETNDIPFVPDTFSYPLWFVKETTYRISFTFLVRNGSCVVFPRDIETGAELTQGSVAENGFYLDFASSNYLEVSVKKEVFSEGLDGSVADVEFNRPAKDGEQYTDEGIYTVTAYNKYTNESTPEKIYVGNSAVLYAHMVTGLSVEEIYDQLYLGAVIEEDGTITSPVTLAEVNMTIPTEMATQLVVQAPMVEVAEDTTAGLSLQLIATVGLVTVVSVGISGFLLGYKKAMFKED